MSFCYVSFWFITTLTTSSTFQKFSRIVLEVEEINLVSCSRHELNVIRIDDSICNDTRSFAVSIRRNAQLSVDNVTYERHFFAIILKRILVTNIRIPLTLDVLLQETSVFSCDCPFPKSFDRFLPRQSYFHTLSDDSGKMELMSSLTCWTRGISFNIGMKRIIIKFIFKIMK